MIGRAINDVTINGIFGAGGDTMFDMYSLAVCMWCLAIPLAAAGTYYFHWPVVVVYACTCIDEVGKLPCTPSFPEIQMGEGPDTLTFSKPVFSSSGSSRKSAVRRLRTMQGGWRCRRRNIQELQKVPVLLRCA